MASLPNPGHELSAAARALLKELQDLDGTGGDWTPSENYRVEQAEERLERALWDHDAAS